MSSRPESVSLISARLTPSYRCRRPHQVSRTLHSGRLAVLVAANARLGPRPETRGAPLLSLDESHLPQRDHLGPRAAQETPAGPIRRRSRYARGRSRADGRARRTGKGSTDEEAGRGVGAPRRRLGSVRLRRLGSGRAGRGSRFGRGQHAKVRAVSARVCRHFRAVAGMRLSRSPPNKASVLDSDRRRFLLVRMIARLATTTLAAWLQKRLPVRSCSEKSPLEASK